MRTRYKLFHEFSNEIKIAYRTANGGKGVAIVCRKNILLSTKFKPWNTQETKRTLLIKLYIETVLAKINVSEKISRMPGCEWVGRRVQYKNKLSIVVDAKEMVDIDTGEIVQKLWLWNDLRTVPFSITEDQLHTKL